MSVVAENRHGWVLDSRSLIDRDYSRCVRFEDERKTRVRCRFKSRCFSVSKSHIGVGDAAALGGDADPAHGTDKPPKKRKRRHSELNQGEIDQQAFH